MCTKQEYVISISNIIMQQKTINGTLCRSFSLFAGLEGFHRLIFTCIPLEIPNHFWSFFSCTFTCICTNSAEPLTLSVHSHCETNRGHWCFFILVTVRGETWQRYDFYFYFADITRPNLLLYLKQMQDLVFTLQQHKRFYFGQNICHQGFEFLPRVSVCTAWI